jgi:hypothetical protein
LGAALPLEPEKPWSEAFLRSQGECRPIENSGTEWLDDRSKISIRELRDRIVIENVLAQPVA